jgi:hypothetical protein
VTREPAIAEAIAGVVATYRLRRVPLRELLTAAASVDRTTAAAVGWRTRVLAALTALAEEGRIELPRKLDRSAHPPLPVYVTRPAAERPPAPPDAVIVWHTDLGWAARRDDKGELGSADRRLLAAINAWLPRRRGSQSADAGTVVGDI